MTPEQSTALRAEFPASHIGLLPKVTKKDGEKSKCKECGGWLLPHIHLDYVGHAAVTDRLLVVDPLWNWEPLAWTDDGFPRFDLSDSGDPIGLWIKLTVCGVTRLGYGSVAGGAFDAEKQLIGDALRNAAMRFGVALDLWIKGHAEDDERNTDDRQRPQRAPHLADADSHKKLRLRVSELSEEQKPLLAAWMDENGIPKFGARDSLTLAQVSAVYDQIGRLVRGGVSTEDNTQVPEGVEAENLAAVEAPAPAPQGDGDQLAVPEIATTVDEAKEALGGAKARADARKALAK